MLGVFLLLSLLSVAFGGKLSEAENLERSQTCGRVVQQKVLGGTNVAPNEAPWVAAVHYRKGNKWLHMGGNVISSRHILTAARTVISYDSTADNKFKWVSDDSEVDMTLCKDGVIEIPSKYVDGLSARACGHKECYYATNLHAKRAVYIGSCESKKLPFGVVVMEMEMDFAMDRGALPVCVSSKIEAKDGDEVELYGLGPNDASAKGELQMNKGTTTVKDCGAKAISTFSVCFESIHCKADVGAAYVKKEDEQMTAVAVPFFGVCRKKLDAQVSVKAVFSQICEFSGICEPNADAGAPGPKRISGKLNEEENRERAAKCGNQLQSKLFGGQHIPGTDAPWTAVVNADKVGVNASWYGGFIASKRHVVASSRAVFPTKKSESFKWRHDGKAADLSTCQDGKMEVPDHITNYIRVTLCGGGTDNCDGGATISARKATYIGNCDPTATSMGMVLIELEVDVNEDYTKYLCLPESPVTSVDDELTVYSVGSLDRNGTKEQKVNTIKTKVVACEDSGALTPLLVCVNDVSGCKGDSGAAYTKNVDGKVTAVAVDYRGQCKSNNKKFGHPSTAAFFNQICEVSGICKPAEPTTTAPPTPEPTSEPTSEPTTEEPITTSTEAPTPPPTPAPTSRPVEPAPPPKDNGNSEQQNQNPEKEDGSEENKEDGGDNNNSESNSEHAAEDTDVPAEDGAHGAKVLELIAILASFWYLY